MITSKSIWNILYEKKTQRLIDYKDYLQNSLDKLKLH